MTKLRGFSIAFMIILGLVGASVYGVGAPRLGGVLLFSGVILILRLAADRAAGRPWVPAAPRSYRPRNQGVWEDPPVAELDKSTFGLLLASRLRRVPGLRVAEPRTVRNPAPPGSSDELWDRELDG